MSYRTTVSFPDDDWKFIKKSFDKKKSNASSIAYLTKYAASRINVDEIDNQIHIMVILDSLENRMKRIEINHIRLNEDITKIYSDLSLINKKVDKIPTTDNFDSLSEELNKIKKVFVDFLKNFKK